MSSFFQAHYHDKTFATQPDGTPDGLSSINMRPELEDIIKQLVNYSQGKRPHTDAVISSAYFMVKIEEEEEAEEEEVNEEQKEEVEDEEKVEENVEQEEGELETEEGEEETKEEVKEEPKDTEEEAPVEDDDGR